MERSLITDVNNAAASATAQSEVAVMFDIIASDIGGPGNAPRTGAGSAKFNHIPGGCNVLYMDGHVEFVRYDTTEGPYPVTPQMANILRGANGTI